LNFELDIDLRSIMYIWFTSITFELWT